MKVIENTHIAVSDFTEGTKNVMWIDSLMRSPVGIDRVTDALGFTRRTVHAGKLRFPGMPCIRCDATTPTIDPNRWTIYRTTGTFPHNPSSFRCEMGGHAFTLGDLIAYYNPTKQKVRALLEKIGSHEPHLIRTYTAEYGDSSVTSKDAEAAAIEVLPAVHDCTVGLVGIDAPSLKIGRQIAGQCHDDLPWATVDVKPNAACDGLAPGAADRRRAVADDKPRKRSPIPNPEGPRVGRRCVPPSAHRGAEIMSFGHGFVVGGCTVCVPLALGYLCIGLGRAWGWRARALLCAETRPGSRRPF
jgi:hypothetical protein